MNVEGPQVSLSQKKQQHIIGLIFKTKLKLILFCRGTVILHVGKYERIVTEKP